MSDLNIEDILKQNSDQADDISKAVLVVYKHDLDHEVNNEALAKLTVPYLETCADYLQIKLVDSANNKLFSTKIKLADQIILAIESYFPATCQDCNMQSNLAGLNLRSVACSVSRDAMTVKNVLPSLSR